MKLIMKTQWDNIRNNELHEYDVNTNGDKQVVKIYRDGLIVAKMVKIKKSIRYFAIQNFEQYLTNE